MSNVYIIGAGAAGYFLAITLREISPNSEKLRNSLCIKRASHWGREMQRHQHI